MKNLCFLLICCVSIISCAEKANIKDAHAKTVAQKSTAGNCNDDAFSFVNFVNNKSSQDVAEIKCSIAEKKGCNGAVAQKANTASCSESAACKVGQTSKLAGVSLMKTAEQCTGNSASKCNTAKVSVAVKNASASL